MNPKDPPVKRPTIAMPADPGSTGCAGAASAEAALEAEAAALGEWLTAQGLDPRRDNAHADEGSRDRLYWRYGYFVGLEQALRILSGRRITLH